MMHVGYHYDIMHAIIIIITTVLSVVLLFGNCAWSRELSN